LPDIAPDAEKSISTRLRWRNSQRADACALLKQRTSTKREPEIFPARRFWRVHGRISNVCSALNLCAPRRTYRQRSDPANKTELIMKTTMRLFGRSKASRRSVLIATTLTASALMALVCGQSSAAAWGAPWGRALNPQPLPPGLYSPYHPGLTGGQIRTPLNVHPTARRVCVAWGRTCVKAGQGTPTHPAPCEQYEYVCRKYG
jgi:hypothetical protein